MRMRSPRAVTGGLPWYPVVPRGRLRGLLRTRGSRKDAEAQVRAHVLGADGFEHRRRAEPVDVNEPNATLSRPTETQHGLVRQAHAHVAHELRGFGDHGAGQSAHRQAGGERRRRRKRERRRKRTAPRVFRPRGGSARRGPVGDGGESVRDGEARRERAPRRERRTRYCVAPPASHGVLRGLVVDATLLQRDAAMGEQDPEGVVTTALGGSDGDVRLRGRRIVRRRVVRRRSAPSSPRRHASCLARAAPADAPTPPRCATDCLPQGESVLPRPSKKKFPALFARNAGSRTPPS